MELETRQLLSHFRYSNVSWEPIRGQANTVEFHFQFAARLSSSGAGTAIKPGDITTDTTGSTPFNFGDGVEVSPLRLRVLSVNTAGGYYLAEAVRDNGAGAFEEGLVHTYAAAGNFTAFSESSARINNLNNNSSGSYRTETLVNVGTSNRSPVSALAPIVQVADNTVAMFQIPAADPDGDVVTYRLATSKEASGTTGHSQPPGLAISPTGLVTWNIQDSGGTATKIGDLWTSHVIVEDRDASNNIKSTIGLDLILQVVSTVSAPPVFDLTPATSLPIAAGRTTTFVVQAFDPDTADTVALQALNPPAGMTFTTVPVAAGSRSNAVAIQATFSPDAQQATQTFVITYQATDSTGVSAQAAVILSPNVVALPTVSVADTTVTEGSSGTVDAVFTITLSELSTQPVTVDVATSDGTANAPSDYVATTTTRVTFAPGQTSQTFAVTINSDAQVEADETFFVDLSIASGATLGDGQALGTIRDTPPVEVPVPTAPVPMAPVPTAPVTTAPVPSAPVPTAPVDDVTGPTVVSLRRLGFHAHPTSLVVTFSEDLDANRAALATNYAVSRPGRGGRFGAAGDAPVPITSATYDPAARSVTLRLGRRLQLRRAGILRLKGVGPDGVADRAGNLLDGDADGRPGGDFARQFDGSILAGQALGVKESFTNVAGRSRSGRRLARGSRG